MKNRVVKFRAWDFIINQMFVPTMINQYGDVRHNGIAIAKTKWREKGEQFETWLCMDTDTFHLMQYTGLKDRNGKEIYEGDILFGKEEGNGETTAWTDVYYIVFFKDGAFHIRENNIDEDSKWCDYLNSNDILDYYEVIGNIYENPDLIKK